MCLVEESINEFENRQNKSRSAVRRQANAERDKKRADYSYDSIARECPYCARRFLGDRGLKKHLNTCSKVDI